MLVSWRQNSHPVFTASCLSLWVVTSRSVDLPCGFFCFCFVWQLYRNMKLFLVSTLIFLWSLNILFPLVELLLTTTWDTVVSQLFTFQNLSLVSTSFLLPSSLSVSPQADSWSQSAYGETLRFHCLAAQTSLQLWVSCTRKLFALCTLLLCPVARSNSHFKYMPLQLLSTYWNLVLMLVDISYFLWFLSLSGFTH